MCCNFPKLAYSQVTIKFKTGSAWALNSNNKLPSVLADIFIKPSPITKINNHVLLEVFLNYGLFIKIARNDFSRVEKNCAKMFVWDACESSWIFAADGQS